MRRSGHKAGFTLAEVLVAVGAVAVLSVGLASIFQAVGKTLTTGRRVSAFTQFATLVERQMRADFEQMSRQGFLVIHHAYAMDPGGNRLLVAQSDASTNKSLRRVDEIMFFASGEFASSREPMVAGAVARSGNAAIYYGHGVRWPQSFGASYEFPEVDSAPLAYPPLTLGFAPSGGGSIEDYPNQYASAWTLLRSVTLLSPLSSTETRPAPGGAFGYPETSPFLVDQDLQITLQPASSSLFRSLSRVMPSSSSGFPPPPGVRPLRDASGGGPIGRLGQRWNGLIDIATTDLAEIRSISQTLSFTNGATRLAPDAVTDADAFVTFRQDQVEADLADPLGRPGGFNLIPGLNEAQLRSGSTNDARTLANIQEWMRNAFPANSFGDPSAGLDGGVFTRMRYEAEPPKYFEATALTNDLERTYRRADQLMLTSNVFVPRCSEFIVEWSFGQTDTSGRPVWYGGRERLGALDETIRLYPGSSASVGAMASWHLPFSSLPAALKASRHPLSPYLVYRFDEIEDYRTGQALAQATAHFGYVDPTWPAGSPATGALTSSDPDTLAWAWPRLIRVTMTLVDPMDPEISETFQFVFEVPADPKP